MSKNLLPCPFCGGEGYATYKTNNHGDKDHHVFCQAGCGGWIRDQVSEKKAIAAWNRRAAKTDCTESACAVPVSDKSVCGAQNAKCDPQQAAPIPLSIKALGVGGAPEQAADTASATESLPQLNDDLIAILGRPRWMDLWPNAGHKDRSRFALRAGVPGRPVPCLERAAGGEGDVMKPLTLTLCIILAAVASLHNFTAGVALLMTVIITDELMEKLP